MADGIAAVLMALDARARQSRAPGRAWYLPPEPRPHPRPCECYAASPPAHQARVTLYAARVAAGLDLWTGGPRPVWAPIPGLSGDWELRPKSSRYRGVIRQFDGRWRAQYGRK